MQAKPPSSIVLDFHDFPSSVDFDMMRRVPAPGSLALGGVPVGMGSVGGVAGLAEAGLAEGRLTQGGRRGRLGREGDATARSPLLGEGVDGGVGTDDHRRRIRAGELGAGNALIDVVHRLGPRDPTVGRHRDHAAYGRCRRERVGGLHPETYGQALGVGRVRGQAGLVEPFEGAQLGAIEPGELPLGGLGRHRELPGFTEVGAAGHVAVGRAAAARRVTAGGGEYW